MSIVCRFVGALLLIAAAAVPAANGAIIQFDLNGKSAPGMNAGNETNTVTGTPGSGGEVSPGIFYDDVSNLLDIHIAWGSGNGFTDLTGTATAGHIHGPTASSAPTAYNEAASPVSGLAHFNTLAGWNASASAGSFHHQYTLTTLQEAELLAQRYYVNIHTGTNGAGEIRGHLVIVPEPASAALLGLMAAMPLLIRRR